MDSKGVLQNGRTRTWMLIHVLVLQCWQLALVCKILVRSLNKMKYGQHAHFQHLQWKNLGCSIFPVVYCVSERAMAPHSSTLAWKIPWMEEPGRLRSMGSRRVGHDWATSLSLFPFMHWRRKWQPTQVFLPGESQGWGSLVGCRLWGRTESDTTEAT